MGDDVPTVSLPHDAAIPQLGFGTWELRGPECREAVAEALDVGYTHIDTAEGYRNEEEIGAAVGDRDRDELWITSKVWRDHLRRGDLRRACEGSLRRLGTEYLDLLLIHWPNRAIPIEETIDGMRELREKGMIRAWGVSNFTIGHMEETVAVERPATNQVELHPFFNQEELVSACDGMGVPITAYSPIAKGRVFGSDVLEEIGRAHDRSPAQVALRWEVQHGYVVIPRSSDPDHIRSNARIFDFELSDDEMQRIDGIPQGERMVDGEWSEFDR